MVEAFQETERIVDVGGFLGEAVAVVLQFEFGMHLLGCQFVLLREHGDVGRHVGFELLLGDAADAGVLVVEGDVGEVVDGGEDAELRELGDACDETETYHLLVGLERLVEFLL